jgi:hypothetical protein
VAVTEKIAVASVRTVCAAGWVVSAGGTGATAVVALSPPPPQPAIAATIAAASNRPKNRGPGAEIDPGMAGLLGLRGRAAIGPR